MFKCDILSYEREKGDNIFVRIVPNPKRQTIYRPPVGTVHLYETANIHHPAYTNCIDIAYANECASRGNNLFVENLPSIVFTHTNGFDDTNAQSIVT